MKIPKKVRISGFDFSIKYPYNSKNFKWAAEIDHDRHAIRIASRSLSGLKKANSEIELNLLHEIIHAVNCRYLSTGNRLKENQVQQISQGLYQVLKDNRIRF